MERAELLSAGADMIYLAACALHGKLPKKETVERMDLARVYKQASRHSMAAVTYMGLEAYLKEYGTEHLVGMEPLLKQWKQNQLYSIRRTLQFDLEREKIQRFFVSRGIWYMPLKGLVFQNYYPKLGMRQMGDNDILFDSAYRGELRDFMTQNGYTVKYYDSPYPDAYLKGGYYFEMHTSLYNDTESEADFYRYYRDVKDRLVKDTTDPCAYRFTDEDFYVYCITHSYKHFTGGGHGVRSLMDIYVYRRRMEPQMNLAYIETEMQRLGVAKFDRRAVALAKKLFDESCPNLNDTPELLNEAETELAVYYISTGTFGTPLTYMNNRLDELTDGEQVTAREKLKYCRNRLFPNMDYYKLNHPRVYKHKILIPFFLLYRALRCVFRKPRAFWEELVAVIKAK